MSDNAEEMRARAEAKVKLAYYTGYQAAVDRLVMRLNAEHERVQGEIDLLRGVMEGANG